MLDPNIFDNGFLLSIIAINLTLIGLTSLSETRKVIGVDYGKFLISDAYLFGRIKYKHFILFFTFINITATISLIWTQSNSILLTIIGYSLVLSVCLLLVYFISSILFINKSVEKQIYISTLGNLYSSIPRNVAIETKHNFFDSAIDIPEGRATDKKLISDVYRYFNDDSFAVKKSFEIIFGPNSFIYQIETYHKKLVKYGLLYNKFNSDQINYDDILHPYKYRIIDGNYDISHEFFQMFRYTEKQSTWAMTAYRLTKKQNVYNFISYSNLLRILGNTLLYGTDPYLYNQRFHSFITKQFLMHYEGNRDFMNYTFINDYAKKDFNKLEEQFLEMYFEFAITSILKSVSNYNLKPSFELIDEIKRVINSNTLISVTDKREIFNTKYAVYKNISVDFSDKLIKLGELTFS